MTPGCDVAVFIPLLEVLTDLHGPRMCGPVPEFNRLIDLLGEASETFRKLKPATPEKRRLGEQPE